jgi:hypothetical protein
MMNFRYFLFTICFPVLLSAQNKDSLNTPDQVMKAFYQCLDVTKGKHIDSTRFMNLFWPGTKLEGIAPSRKDTALVTNFSITPQEYLRSMKGFTATHRFKEWETGRKTISFGHMMTVYSSYELIDVHPRGDTTHITGVNVFHLMYDNERWWITYCTYEEKDPGDKTSPAEIKQH